MVWPYPKVSLIPGNPTISSNSAASNILGLNFQLRLVYQCPRRYVFQESPHTRLTFLQTGKSVIEI